MREVALTPEAQGPRSCQLQLRSGGPYVCHVGRLSIVRFRHWWVELGEFLYIILSLSSALLNTISAIQARTLLSRWATYSAISLQLCTLWLLLSGVMALNHSPVVVL